MQEHADEIAAAKMEAVKERHRREAAAAQERVSGFVKVQAVDADSGLNLAWRLVMTALVKDLEVVDLKEVSPSKSIYCCSDDPTKPYRATNRLSSTSANSFSHHH